MDSIRRRETSLNRLFLGLRFDKHLIISAYLCKQCHPTTFLLRNSYCRAMGYGVPEIKCLQIRFILD